MPDNITLAVKILEFGSAVMAAVGAIAGTVTVYLSLKKNLQLVDSALLKKFNSRYQSFPQGAQKKLKFSFVISPSCKANKQTLSNFVSTLVKKNAFLFTFMAPTSPIPLTGLI